METPLAREDARVTCCTHAVFVMPQSRSHHWFPRGNRRFRCYQQAKKGLDSCEKAGIRPLLILVICKHTRPTVCNRRRWRI